jgi:diaminohydroxyphosphoribosylaminopyrimidine deaminase / 5-amino-6-(5-phosphoribosylamino)uracil reductase
MTMSSAEPGHFMARALELAARGRATTHPNPRVGCVLVRDGEVVGEGWHERAGEPHAEIFALNAAGSRACGAEAFVTLEPCCHFGRTGPCTDALITAGVRKVWAAMPDPNPKVSGQGFAKLREAGVVVEVGLHQAEAEVLNRGFSSRMRRGRPWLTLKIAASLDGRTAMASGESKWITGDEARLDVHRLRAEAGAVLTSADTVLADDPQLTARGEYSSLADRIVIDSSARVGTDAKVWARDGARCFWITGATGVSPPHVERIAVPVARGHVDLSATLVELGRREINEVLVECGPKLAGALIQQQLVDELVLYLAPGFLGHRGQPVAVLPGLRKLEQRVQLKFNEISQVGPDLRVTASLV